MCLCRTPSPRPARGPTSASGSNAVPMSCMCFSKSLEKTTGHCGPFCAPSNCRTAPPAAVRAQFSGAFTLSSCASVQQRAKLWLRWSFQSARVVLTGVSHPSSASIMAARVLRRIQHTQQSIALGIHQLRVVNIVGVQTFPQRISVERLQNTLGGIYDPTIFPALRCKLLNGVTCLVYISGKIIVTGAQSLDILHQSFTNLSNIIPNYFRA
ncbi:hypothetical protein niasHT_015981 [Heterodera trifolii]|uniref:Uncharacterized protein n=1 Tax=Heterodera trifolii TaxID=157864 RepID=A0ABD2KUS5_9BILA